MLNFLATKQAALRHTYTHRYLFSTPPLEKRRKQDWKTDVVGLRQNKKESNSTTVKKKYREEAYYHCKRQLRGVGGSERGERERVCLLCTVQ